MIPDYIKPYSNPYVVTFIGEIIFRLLRKRNDKNKDFLKCKRILVVCLDEIGDVVLTTPFIRELRRNFPDSSITFVVKPETYNLLEVCPYIDELLIYNRIMSGCMSKLINQCRAVKLSVDKLLKKNFDLAILPRWDIDGYNGSFLVYFSGAEVRLGYSEYVAPKKNIYNRNYDRLFTNLINDKSIKHGVEHNLQVIEFLGGQVENDELELWIKDEDKEYANILLEKQEVAENSFLTGVGPGALLPRKRWPVDRFTKIIEKIIQHHSVNVALFGSKNEGEFGKYIEENIGVSYKPRIINLIGKTTLRQAAAVLQNCKIYVGNDSGLAHIAAAMKVPVVRISSWNLSGDKSSQNSNKRFMPWKVKHVDVNPEKPTSPCRGECVSLKPHCILQVQEKDVEKAIDKLISLI